VGNPNSGKSSLFNRLTGLQQKIGNYPGVTVDKKVGTLQIAQDQKVELIDLPGTYSLFPLSDDERVVAQYFCTPQQGQLPDGIVYVADITQADRHLLLFSQLYDLGLPMILVLNMADRVNLDGWQPPIEKLSQQLGIPVLTASSKTGRGISDLLALLNDWPTPTQRLQTYDLSAHAALMEDLQKLYPQLLPYQAKLLAHHYEWLPELTESERQNIGSIVQNDGFKDLTAQVNETMERFDRLDPITQLLTPPKELGENGWSDRLDRWLVHPIVGNLVFLAILIVIFQAVYAWSEAPMDLIEAGFTEVAEMITITFPAGWGTDLLTQGILPGLAGVLVFIPQITILFLLIAFLEEIGYMARAAALMDGLMQRFGLNGRSVVALVSGHACAIPAIMSTRTIANWKERLITILVTPFTGCSARIPIYIVLIGFVVPSQTVWGIFNLQGLAFTGLYLLGILGALGFAYLLKLLIKTNETSYLMLELPAYRSPNWRMIGSTA
ncbi:MAG: ferrous iron transport protein B, partial [Bacteroidota bacterium]